MSSVFKYSIGGASDTASDTSSWSQRVILAAPDNLEKVASYLVSSLKSCGFTGRLNFLSGNPEDIANTFNCINFLIQRIQQEKDRNDLSQSDLKKLRNENQMADNRIIKLKKEIKGKEKDIGSIMIKKRASNDYFAEEIEKLNRDKEQLTKKCNNLTRLQVQFQHEIRRKEVDYYKLQETLNRYLNEKKREKKATMEIVGKFKAQTQSQNLSSNPKSVTNASKNPEENNKMINNTDKRNNKSKLDESTVQVIVKAYEEKQRDLMTQVKDLSAALDNLQKEHSVLINSQLRKPVRISSSRTFKESAAGAMNCKISNKDMTSSSDEIASTSVIKKEIAEDYEQSPTTSLTASFESDSTKLLQNTPDAEVKLISEENNKTKNITNITSNSSDHKLKQIYQSMEKTIMNEDNSENVSEEMKVILNKRRKSIENSYDHSGSEAIELNTNRNNNEIVTISIENGIESNICYEKKNIKDDENEIMPWPVNSGVQLKHVQILKENASSFSPKNSITNEFLNIDDYIDNNRNVMLEAGGSSSVVVGDDDDGIVFEGMVGQEHENNSDVMAVTLPTVTEERDEDRLTPRLVQSILVPESTTNNIKGERIIEPGENPERQESNSSIEEVNESIVITSSPPSIVEEYPKSSHSNEQNHSDDSDVSIKNKKLINGVHPATISPFAVAGGPHQTTLTTASSMSSQPEVEVTGKLAGKIVWPPPPSPVASSNSTKTPITASPPRPAFGKLPTPSMKPLPNPAYLSEKQLKQELRERAAEVEETVRALKTACASIRPEDMKSVMERRMFVELSLAANVTEQQEAVVNLALVGLDKALRHAPEVGDLRNVETNHYFCDTLERADNLTKELYDSIPVVESNEEEEEAFDRQKYENNINELHELISDLYMRVEMVRTDMRSPSPQVQELRRSSTMSKVYDKDLKSLKERANELTKKAGQIKQDRLNIENVQDPSSYDHHDYQQEQSNINHHQCHQYHIEKEQKSRLNTNLERNKSRRLTWEEKALQEKAFQEKAKEEMPCEGDDPLDDYESDEGEHHGTLDTFL